MQTLGTASRFLRGTQMTFFHAHSVTMEILSSQLPRTTRAESGDNVPSTVYLKFQNSEYDYPPPMSQTSLDHCDESATWK
jgi:hypothetical protein